jgi:hypothetical protein
MQKTTQKQHFSLVVEPYPLEKYEFVRLDHHPSYWGKYVLVMLSHVPNHQPEHVVAPKADLSGRPRPPTAAAGVCGPWMPDSKPQVGCETCQKMGRELGK